MDILHFACVGSIFWHRSNPIAWCLTSKATKADQTFCKLLPLSVLHHAKSDEGNEDIVGRTNLDLIVVPTAKSATHSKAMKAVKKTHFRWAMKAVKKAKKSIRIAVDWDRSVGKCKSVQLDHELCFAILCTFMYIVTFLCYFHNIVAKQVCRFHCYISMLFSQHRCQAGLQIRLSYFFNLHPKLNIGSRPIANKYHERKTKRTLERCRKCMRLLISHSIIVHALFHRINNCAVNTVLAESNVLGLTYPFSYVPRLLCLCL